MSFHTPPLFFVEFKPAPESPAALAGLRAGDAVLSFGDAATIDEVGATLRTSQRIEARVMGRNGVVRERLITPRVFDPSKPQSLFGCQITDSCPVRFIPHPALRGLSNETAAAPAPEEPASEPVRSSNVVESMAFLRELTKPRWHEEGADTFRQYEDGGNEDSEERPRGRMHTVPLRAVATEDDDPATAGPDAPDAPDDEIAVTRCAASYLRVRWRSRCALLMASLSNLAHGCALFAAPSLHAESAIAIEAFRVDLLRMTYEACVRNDDEEGAVAAFANATDDADADGLETDDDGLPFGAFVRIALIISSLEMLLSIGGLALASLSSESASCRGAIAVPEPCRHCGRAFRRALSVLYPPTAFALWLLLAGATMYCLSFRFEADNLLRHYRQCLAPSQDGGGGNDGGAAPMHSLEDDRQWSRLVHSIGAVAVMCATADLSAVLSLVAACSLVGWRAVLRYSMLVFGALSAIGGGVLASLGAVLLHIADERGAALAYVSALALLSIGLTTCPLGVLGAFAARHEQTLLLLLHAAMLASLSLAFAALLVVLLIGGAEALRPTLEHLVGDDEGADDEAGAGVDEIVDALQAHGLALSATSVLGLFLLVVNGMMAIGLRWIVTGQLVVPAAASDDAHNEYERVGVSVAAADADDDSDDERAHELAAGAQQAPWPEEWMEAERGGQLVAIPVAREDEENVAIDDDEAKAREAIAVAAAEALEAEDDAEEDVEADVSKAQDEELGAGALAAWGV